MFKNILVLDDGTELSAGKAGIDAIIKLTHTSTVNSETNLLPGATCSDKIELVLWVQPGGSLRITSGTRMTFFRQDEAGRRKQVGVFTAVKPTRASRNTYKVYAYDNISKTDGNLSPWLRSIQGEFPMPLETFARRVAEKCGLTLAGPLPRNGDYLVRAFYADDLTGRQLLSWVAESTATFCHCTPAGEVDFSWYQPFKAKITPATTVIPTIFRPDGRVFRQGVEEYGYLSGSLTYEDYTTPAIDKVQIRQSDSDVGVIYPAEEQGSSAWVIQSNLLLTTDSDANLRPVAQALYEAFRGIAYTPCSFSVPASVEIEAGSIVELEDVRGNRFTTYVMEATVSGSKRTLRSTGNAKRDGNAATNRQILKNLTGKMLEIQTSVDGLNIKASQLDGNFAELQLTVEGLSSRVEQDFTEMQGYVDEQTGQVLETAQSSITQTANSIRAEVKATYATQDYADTLAEDMLASAQSAITQSAAQIRSEISASYATKAYADTAADSALQSAKSSITQTADSIKAEVSASYATKSSLNSYTKTSEVRSRFAMDASSVTVESGAVTFKGNTFRVSATNFNVDANGTVRLQTADSYSRATIANGVFEIACKRNGSWRRAVTMASHNTGVSDVICYDESNKPAIYMMYTDGVEVSGDGSSVGFGNKYAMLQFGNGAGITSGIVGYNQSIPGQSLIFYGSSERQYGLKLGVTDGTWALAPVTARYLQLGTPQHPFDTIYCKQVVQV